jgi:hypothetical protein
VVFNVQCALGTHFVSRQTEFNNIFTPPQPPPPPQILCIGIGMCGWNRSLQYYSKMLLR